MAIELSKEKLAEVLAGQVAPAAGKFSVHGVCFDSRDIRGGELFVALPGEKMHGHTFLDKAFGSGAALALVEDAELLKTYKEAERLVFVPDTLKAFWSLAAWWRRNRAIPVCAITGSVGKTSCKEYLARILMEAGRGCYSLKSFNNHTGVPHTILRIGTEDTWAVLEMGMNAAGELDKLSRLAEPDIALITRIAPAHTQAFASIDAVADAKCEILNGLKPGATLIINGDDEILARALTRHPLTPSLKILRFGEAENSDALITNLKSQGLGGIQFHLKISGQSYAISMQVVGIHNAMNAAAAALAAHTLKPELPLEKIFQTLAKITPPNMRMKVYQLTGNRVLVDDSYNANPVAMRALFALAKEEKDLGHSIGLILGDMRELGEKSLQYHEEIAAEAAKLKPVGIVAVGEYAKVYTDAARAAGVSAFEATSPEAAGQIARKLICQVLFVKASRGVELERCVKVILDAEEDISMPPPDFTRMAAMAEAEGHMPDGDEEEVE